MKKIKLREKVFKYRSTDRHGRETKVQFSLFRLDVFVTPICMHSPISESTNC